MESVDFKSTKVACSKNTTKLILALRWQLLILSKCTRDSNNENFNEVLSPKHVLDEACEFVLAVEEGKQLKAHRNVLPEASPFFGKLLYD